MTKAIPLYILINMLNEHISLLMDKDKFNEMTDLQKAYTKLIGASVVNLWTFLYFYDKHEGLYPLAGASRFILESYADANYLCFNQKEASKYINIHKEYNNFASSNPSNDELNEYMVNKISIVGRLCKPTTKRVADVPEKKLASSYGLLNCYTHPNPASIDWNYNDDEGAINRYFLYIAIESFFGIVKLMQSSGMVLDYDKLNGVRVDIINNFCAVENRR